MSVNNDKIDDAALALLYLTLHDGYRAWKGLDWDVLDRLHEKGLIGNPVGKTPWEGPLSVGEHLVTLRGSIDLDSIPDCGPDDEGAAAKRAAKRGRVELGTQPVSVPAQLRAARRVNRAVAPPARWSGTRRAARVVLVGAAERAGPAAAVPASPVSTRSWSVARSAGGRRPAVRLCRGVVRSRTSTAARRRCRC